MLSAVEIAIIGGVVVLLFGTKKLPHLGSAIGESIKNFKKGVKDEPPAVQPEKEKKDSGDKG